jgi:hypothetical protein
MTAPDDGLTLRAARAAYFAANGLGDGGYDSPVVKLMAGPIPIYLPNTASRVRAVRFHDLHHVVTGYATTWSGEAEIGAWEIATGCADHVAAWILNLGAMAIGLVIAPAATFRAFLRGRRTRNLYREPFGDPLLDETVGAVRRRLALEAASPGVTARGALAFAAFALAAIATLAAVLASVAGLLAAVAVSLARLFG